MGHLGAMRVGDNNYAFGGIDCAVTSKLTFMMDYTDGPDNFASVGGSYQLNEGLGDSGGAGVPQR